MEISSRAGKAIVNGKVFPVCLCGSLSYTRITLSYTDSAKDMSDDSILTRSQIAARQALRRKVQTDSLEPHRRNL